MEKNETAKTSGSHELQTATTHMIDARVNLAKSILNVIQSTLDSTSTSVKEAINPEGGNSVSGAVSSAINRRAKMLTDFGDRISNVSTKEKK